MSGSGGNWRSLDTRQRAPAPWAVASCRASTIFKPWRARRSAARSKAARSWLTRVMAPWCSNVVDHEDEDVGVDVDPLAAQAVDPVRHVQHGPSPTVVLLPNVVPGPLGALPFEAGVGAQDTPQAGCVPGSVSDRHEADDTVDHADVQRIVGLQARGRKSVGKRGNLPAVAQDDG